MTWGMVWSGRCLTAQILGPRMQQTPTYRYHPAAPCIDGRITPVALAGAALTRYGMWRAERAQ